MRACRMAVIDCETTGFSQTDRIVEIAVVTLDPADGSILDEFDTLLDPGRDIGAQHIHGISAEMVAGAPEFRDIAPMLVQRLHGAVLVAHNAPFDMRFLGYEFARIGAAFDPGRPICTYRATGQKLAIACQDHDIALTLAHSALADARATAALARRVPSPNGTVPARVAGAGQSRTLHTLRRNSGRQSISRLGRIVDRARYPDAADEALGLYLEALDHVLDDFVVERAEQDILDELAATLGLTRERRRPRNTACRPRCTRPWPCRPATCPPLMRVRWTLPPYRREWACALPARLSSTGSRWRVASWRTPLGRPVARFSSRSRRSTVDCWSEIRIAAPPKQRPRGSSASRFCPPNNSWTMLPCPRPATDTEWGRPRIRATTGDPIASVFRKL